MFSEWLERRRPRGRGRGRGRALHESPDKWLSGDNQKRDIWYTLGISYKTAFPTQMQFTYYS